MGWHDYYLRILTYIADIDYFPNANNSQQNEHASQERTAEIYQTRQILGGIADG